MRKIENFSNLNFFLSNCYFFTTGGYILLNHDVNNGGKRFLSTFDQYTADSLNAVDGDINLICIFKFRCPVKKLHGFARSETALNLKYSVWALQ